MSERKKKMKQNIIVLSLNNKSAVSDRQHLDKV